MIDGISFSFAVDNNILNSNPVFDFKEITSRQTGETWTAKKTTYRDLNIAIHKNNVITISGSIHKYAHKVNHTDISFLNIIYALTDLCNVLRIDANTTRLNSFEIGVNISIPCRGDRCLDGLIWHAGRRPNRIEKPGMHYIEFHHTEYSIKIYDKKLQYGIHSGSNLIRIELKIHKMRFIEKRHIQYISDLIDSKKIADINDLLIKKFNEIILFDYSINIDKLKGNEKTIIQDGKDADYWSRCTRQNITYRLNRYRAMIRKLTGRDLQRQVANLIRAKINELTASKKIYPIKHPFEVKRLCRTCLKDISHKKKGALYCSKKCKNDHTNNLLNDRNNLIKRKKRIYQHPVLFNPSTTLMLNHEQQKLLNNQNTIYPTNQRKKTYSLHRPGL
jgi:hypothetical protein